MGDSTDPHMLKWWAQYTESTGDMNGALKIYQKAEDWFSQVPFFALTHSFSHSMSNLFQLNLMLSLISGANIVFPRRHIAC